MEVSVLLEGYLEKCSTASDQGKRDWKKRYFVYKHFTASNIKCLEYYKDRNWRKQDPKGVLTLYPGYDVVKVHDQKRRFVFDIKTVEHTFRLSANSEDEENNWILLLERENIVKSFSVEPVHDDKMNKLGAKDMCQLHVADTELRLISVTDGYQLVAWPFTCLRRYMSSRGKFTIEAGRRAPTGEGKFSFITTQHDEIYKLLDTVIKSKAAKEGTGGTLEKSHAKTPGPVINMPIKNLDDNGYDHLQSSPAPNPPHPTHPNYDQNILPSHTLSGGSKTRRSDDYAAPYGHVKPRESITSFGSANIEIDTLSMSGMHDYNALDQDGFSENFDNTDGYNTLGSTTPGRRPPPAVPLPPTSDFNKGDAEDLYNFIGEAPKAPLVVNRLSGGGGEGDVYNVLDHVPSSPLHTKPPVPPVGNRLSGGGGEGDVYNVLEHNPSSPMNTKPPVPLVGNRLSGGGGESDVYNVLDHAPSSPMHTKPSPLSQVYDNKISPPGGGDANYDNLDHSLSMSNKGAVRALDFGFSKHRQGSIDDGEDGYNVLLHRGSTLQGGTAKGDQTSVDELDNYSTLDRCDTRPAHPPLRKAYSNPTVIPRKGQLTTASHPVPPPRVPRSREETIASPGRESFRSSVSSVSSVGSGFCPLDMSGSFTESICSISPPSSELDFYSSIDEARTSPTTMSPPTKESRSGRTESVNDSSPKASRMKPRKTSAPDVLARTPRPKPVAKFVSNLRASLEAEGLDLSKPPIASRRKMTRRVSTEDTIPESDTYAEINEGAAPRKGSVDGYLGNRDSRSPSAPIEPTEDIYDEPQIPKDGNSRPKSLQLMKPKVSRKK